MEKKLRAYWECNITELIVRGVAYGSVRFIGNI